MGTGFSIYLFLLQAFEVGMKQRQEQLQKLKEKLLNLIKTHPNSPEAAKWKQMLAEIGIHQCATSRWPWVIYVTETVECVLSFTDIISLSSWLWGLSNGKIPCEILDQLYF